MTEEFEGGRPDNWVDAHPEIYSGGLVGELKRALDEFNDPDILNTLRTEKLQEEADNMQKDEIQN